MTNITTVSHPRFGQVRKIRIDEAWFYIAKDVANSLGYADATVPIDQYCKDNVFYHPVTDQLGRIQNFRMLSRADVIRMAHASLNDQADQYTDWLLEEQQETAIIPLHEENDQFPVHGRELHQRLGVKTRYNDWFARMCEYGFLENTDFQAITQKRVTAQGNESTSINHNLTISMAKEICMLQRTEQGRIIRRHLIAVEEAWNSPDAVINRALKISNARVQSLMNDVRQLESRIEQDAPKVLFADSVSASDTDIHVGELAKLLKQNGFDTGRTRLFELLRREGCIMKAQSGEHNIPTQKSMNMGLMRVREETFTPAGQPPKIRPVTMITGKGQLYFIQRYTGARA